MNTKPTPPQDAQDFNRRDFIRGSSLATIMAMLGGVELRAQAPDAFEFRTSPYEFETTIPAFDLLTGSSSAREAIVMGTHPDDVAELIAPVDGAWAEVVREAETRLERARA